jgi:hypothetical protein
MRKVFATQPTCVIAARLARRAGIKKTSDYWPLDLIAITQTPADWADQNPPGPDPRDEVPREPNPREPAPVLAEAALAEAVLAEAAPAEPAPHIPDPARPHAPPPLPARLSRRAFNLAYLIPEPFDYTKKFST